MGGTLPGIHLSVLGGHAQKENRAGEGCILHKFSSLMSIEIRALELLGSHLVQTDAKGQVIQRRKQQIPHALVAHLTQDEEYDELFIITGCCMGCSVTIWLSSSYIPHMPVYSLLHMSRTHNIIYFMFGLLFCCFVFWLFFFYFIIICTQNT